MFSLLSREFLVTARILRRDRFSNYGAMFLWIILLISSLWSYSLTFLLFSVFTLGLIMSYTLIKLQGFTSTSLIRLLHFYKGHISSSKNNQKSCSVCSNFSCDCHRQDFNASPWNDLYIDCNLNAAIERFFNKILNVFVSSWYENLTKDESFLHELKYALRYSTALVIQRVMEIDLPKLMSKKLIPCLVKHIDDITYIEDLAKSKKNNINEVAIEYWGCKLHGAVTNRNNELIYLREVAASLLPILLPPKYFECRNSSVLFQEVIAIWVFLPIMDTALNPDVINTLIIKCDNLKSKCLTIVENPTKVIYLQNFDSPVQQKNSLFYKDLNEVKENTDLLYTFIQFLKEEDQVHLLKFCLDIDQFSNVLMAPDHSKKTLDELYENAVLLQKEYFCPESSNFINCSYNISKEMEDLLKEGIRSIAKLKISAPLMEAYKVVFNNLEENWLPSFYKSNEFYKYLCGLKSSSQRKRTLSNEPNKQETSSSTLKLGGLRKLKSAFMNSSPVEGSRLLPEKENFENVGEIIPPICYNIFRDISTWKISITSYVSLNKVIYFHVNVKRPSTSKETETSRVVLRRDQDFFTLKAKLIEFHGENEIADSPLPARKAGSDIGARMTGYEKFLQKILQNPTLRGSDLLYTFLTTEDDFSLYLSTCGAPVQDLSNIYQSVAQKLRKEKGQHLDNFMKAFILSTGNDKSGSFSTLEIGDEVNPSNAQPQNSSSKTIFCNTYKDNFSVSFKKSRRITVNTVNPLNILQCFFYIGKHFFNVPQFLLKFYVAICNMLEDTFETIWCIFCQKKLNGLCQQHLEYLVTCLEEVIFDNADTSNTTTDSDRRKEETLYKLKNICNEFPYSLFGRNFSEGIIGLWKLLQNPLFNKQLSYQLLDILLLELYPKILQKEE